MNKYVAGIDPASPDGDHSALVVLKQRLDGTIELIASATSAIENFNEIVESWLVRTGQKPIDIRATHTDEAREQEGT